MHEFICDFTLARRKQSVMRILSELVHPVGFLSFPGARRAGPARHKLFGKILWKQSNHECYVDFSY